MNRPCYSLGGIKRLNMHNTYVKQENSPCQVSSKSDKREPLEQPNLHLGRRLVETHVFTIHLLSNSRGILTQGISKDS